MPRNLQKLKQTFRMDYPLERFKTAWSSWKYYNEDIICPTCLRSTTQAALDGNDPADMRHIWYTCPINIEIPGPNGKTNLTACSVGYRLCRGSCPNINDHYDTDDH